MEGETAFAGSVDEGKVVVHVPIKVHECRSYMYRYRKVLVECTDQWSVLKMEVKVRSLNFCNGISPGFMNSPKSSKWVCCVTNIFYIN